MAANQSVLVTGATGQQGGAVARLLLQKGHRVRALVRNPGSTSAQALATAGVELVQGGMEDLESIRSAIRGMNAVFGVTTPFEAGMEAEVAQGRNIADAAAAEGANLVFTSVAWAWAKTGIPHFESKWQVEEHIRALGMPAVILGPCFFMENILSPAVLEGLRRGTLAIPMSATTPQVMIAVRNIADVAVLAIEDFERLRGRRIDIAGDVLTGAEAARVLSEVAGREIGYYPVPVEAVRAQSEDLAIMFEYYDQKRPEIDTAALRREYPEIDWLTFRQWAQMQDWAMLLSQTVAGA